MKGLKKDTSFNILLGFNPFLFELEQDVLELDVGETTSAAVYERREARTNEEDSPSSFRTGLFPTQLSPLTEKLS
jgi:hypothetical protein